MDNFNNNSSTNYNQVPQPVDSIIEVSISYNKLEAIVNIKPPKDGGIEPNMESLRSILESQKITYGVKENILIDICNNPIYNKNIIVAQGTAPVSGIDGTFQMHFETVKDSKPKEREDGTVDFFNLENVESVKQGQILCTLIQPTEGIDGVSVLKEKIPYTKGKLVPTLLGKNTTLSKDGTVIISKIDGQIDFSQGKINVYETLYIKGNVDNSTGNINVAGNVIINGTVLSGFIVKATGNIQIYGGISSVTLISGGYITLRGGVIGSKITCEGDLTSRFIENCKVFTKGNIQTDYVMNSSVKCGKSLKAINSISKLVGGDYLVGENIEARIIGSNANIKTYLELGTDSTTIRRQQELNKEIPPLETKRHSLESLISLLQQFEVANRLTPDKKQMLETALFSYKEISELIDIGKQELEEINESIKSRGYGRVICKGTIHSGTTVKIGSVQMTVHDRLFCKSLYYSEEGICIEPAK